MFWRIFAIFYAILFIFHENVQQNRFGTYKSRQVLLRQSFQ